MSTARDIKLSLFYRVYSIQQILDWLIPETGVTLPQVTSDIDPYAPDNTYGVEGTPAWEFLDSDGFPEASDVTVYDGSTPLASGAYSVDYYAGRVTLNSAPSGIVTADFSRYSAHVLDDYPDNEWLETHDLPAISVGIETGFDEPFAIGTANIWRTHALSVDLLAANDGQRLDMTDDLSRWLHRVPLWKYTQYPPLTSSGTINAAFPPSGAASGAAYDQQGLHFDVNSRYLNPRIGGSNKERWRSLISLRFRTIY